MNNFISLAKKTLLTETWITNRSGKINFLLSIDDGNFKNIKSATIGIRFNVKLKETKSIKKAEYPTVEAARLLQNEIENFIKHRLDKVFASNLYRLENFSKRHPETGYVFPKPYDYDSQSKNIYKFGKSMLVDIYEYVISSDGFSRDQYFDEAKKTIINKLLSDPLFNSKASPWEIV
jgi:hypothetical protein